MCEQDPVQTVQADFPHTAHQVVVQAAALRGPPDTDRPAQAVESQRFEEGAVPESRTCGATTRAGSFHEQAVQPFLDVGIHLRKLLRRIARAEILPPAAFLKTSASRSAPICA